MSKVTHFHAPGTFANDFARLGNAVRSYGRQLLEAWNRGTSQPFQGLSTILDATDPSAHWRNPVTVRGGEELAYNWTIGSVDSARNAANLRPFRERSFNVHFRDFPGHGRITLTDDQYVLLPWGPTTINDWIDAANPVVDSETTAR